MRSRAVRCLPPHEASLRTADRARSTFVNGRLSAQHAAPMDADPESHFQSHFHWEEAFTEEAQCARDDAVQVFESEQTMSKINEA